ncbi:hypothetical protein VRK_21770 [Vibrio sp. MEBiC08052]|nr:hypothetical protein VRK_21770 [Vibrio sp. MEBiC08052]
MGSPDTTMNENKNRHLAKKIVIQKIVNHNMNKQESAWQEIVSGNISV